MGSRFFVYVLFLSAICFLSACSKNRDISQPIDKSEAVKIAYEVVRQNRYDLQKYTLGQVNHMPDFNEWWVWFYHKQPAPVGGDFLVKVDDRTGKALLDEGD